MATIPLYTGKPRTIKRLLANLEAEVVGKTIPYVRDVEDPILGIVLHSSTDIAKYLEEVTFTYAERSAEHARVVAEPHGRNTFPDLSLTYRNNYRQFLEVKTWGLRKGFDVAKVGPLHRSLLALDPKYFTTWYVQWSYSNQDNGIHINGVEIQRIWEVGGWGKTLDACMLTKKDQGHVALRPHWDSFETPLALVFAFAATTIAAPDEQAKAFEQGIKLLRKENLYEDYDLLLLKTRVQSAATMREKRHEFIFDF